MTEECASPGICRSKAGCDCTDEPCTKTSGPRGASARRLRHIHSFTSPAGVFLTVQCSVPAGFSCAFTAVLASRRVEAARNSLRSVIKKKPASSSRASFLALVQLPLVDVAVRHVGARGAFLLVGPLAHGQLVALYRRHLLRGVAVDPGAVAAEDAVLHRAIRRAERGKAVLLLHV